MVKCLGTEAVSGDSLMMRVMGTDGTVDHNLQRHKSLDV